MVSEDSRGLRRVAAAPLVQLWGVPRVGTADQLLQSNFLVSLQCKLEINNVPILLVLCWVVFVSFFPHMFQSYGLKVMGNQIS